MIKKIPFKKRRPGPSCKYLTVVEEVLAILRLGKEQKAHSAWYKIKEGEKPSRVRSSVRNAVQRNLPEEIQNKYNVLSSIQDNDKYVVITLEKRK